MRKSSKLLLLGGVAALVATPALAQTAPTEPATEEAVVEDIIVTAQRRNENLQTTPVTVQAVTASQLQAFGASGTQDIETLVPGVTFNNNLTAALPYIRGVGQNVGAIGVESPVAIYLDGVYLVAPASGLFSFNNIRQIEVAKGPQGTLFGRNSTGGVIQVYTELPSSTPEFRASVGYGNYDTISADFYATGAVAPNLAASISFNGLERREGFIENRFLGRDLGQKEVLGIQNRWLWTPDAETDVSLNLMYNWQLGFQGTTSGVAPGNIADDGVTTHAGQYVTFGAISTQNRDAQALAAITVNHDFGWAEFTTITSYHRLWDRFNNVQNAEPLHTPFLPGRAAVTQYIWGQQESWTQELQLRSPDDQDFRWIAGLFYLHDTTNFDVDDLRENQFIFQGSGAARVRAEQDTESYAAFAEISHEIFEDTRLTLGARYTEDTKELSGTTTSITAGGAIITSTPANPGAIFAPLRTPMTWEQVTYRLVLDHQFTPDIMGYASYNRGFKSGGYNVSLFFNQPVDPEIIDAYEIGLKNTLFDRRLRLNLAGFYYDYADLQLRQTVSQFPGRFLLLNAASSEVRGLDLDFVAVPTANLTIQGGFELLDAEYVDFPGAPFAMPNPVTLPLPAGCSIVGAALPPSASTVGGNTTVSCDASGTRMIRSPEFTGNLGVTYVHELQNGSELSFNLNDHYNSGFYWDVDHRLEQEPYHDLGGSITWTAPGERFSISLWGSNLLDEHIWATAISGSTSTFAPGEPRLFGVSLRVRS